MTRLQVQQLLRSSRRDIGSLLFHFTRRKIANAFTGQPEVATLEVLKTILREQVLKGSSGYIKGSHKCVCFTEAPIGELASFFSAVQASDPDLSRYEPYGIAVKKEWLFAQGGRPVIYQPQSEYAGLPDTHAWRHVAYNPPHMDFSWEREWRIQVDSLSIAPDNCLVIVPTAREAHEVNYGFSQLFKYPEQQNGVEIISSTATWNAVSLDLYGL